MTIIELIASIKSCRSINRNIGTSEYIKSNFHHVSNFNYSTKQVVAYAKPLQ